MICWSLSENSSTRRLPAQASCRTLRRHGVSHLNALLRAENEEEAQPAKRKTFKDLDAYFASPLALCARRVSSAASRLLGTTSPRFALHG